LISISTIPLLLVATNIFKNGIKSAFQDVRTQVARINTFVQEHITGMNIVQIFNQEEAELKKFKEINKEHADAHIRSVWHYSVFLPIVEILSAVSIGLLIWLGARGVIDGTFSAGNLVAFTLYVNMLFRPIRTLADRFNTLQMGMVSSERVFKLLDEHEYVADTGTYVPEEIKGAINDSDRTKADATKTRLAKMRKEGLAETGEWGAENIAYKTLRNKGLIDALSNHIRHLQDKELSLEQNRL
jgi:ATP-binding cassette subfamily B protein